MPVTATRHPRPCSPLARPNSVYVRVERVSSGAAHGGAPNEGRPQFVVGICLPSANPLRYSIPMARSSSRNGRSDARSVPAPRAGRGHEATRGQEHWEFVGASGEEEGGWRIAVTVLPTVTVLPKSGGEGGGEVVLQESRTRVDIAHCWVA